MKIVTTGMRLLQAAQKLAIDPFAWQASRRELRQRLAGASSMADIVEAAWAYQGQGFYKRLRPGQDRWEISTLAERVQALAPTVIVEIGTRLGGTLFIWSQSSPALQLLVSIDLPGGIHGGGYSLPRARLYRQFVENRPGCQLHLLRRDSQQPATRDELLRLLAGRPIDFLFIDGDHRYEGVRKDYQLYRGLVRPGGLIAFHDIRPNPDLDSCQVYRLWDEIRAGGGQHEEIVNEPYRGKYGIGVLTQGASPAG